MPKTDGTITRTLVLLKPDAIERNLAGEILKRFERKGLKIVASEMRWIDKPMAEKHYVEHKNNPAHFKQMTEALMKGPLMAIVLEGPSAVTCSRQLIGSQSPIYHSQVGTIRADFAIAEPYNLVHGSDSDQAAKREVTLWFGANMYKASKPTTKPAINNPFAFADKILPVMPAPPKVPKKVNVPDPEELNKWQTQVVEFLKSNPGQPMDEWLATITKESQVLA